MTLQNRLYDVAADALFLDFDGTLVDLAPEPGQVMVPPDLTAILHRLHQAAGGALAIVSGRPLQQIDHFLAPLCLPGAGVHGAERRGANGHITQLPVPDTKRLQAYLSPLVKQHTGLLLELKRGALALHYRQVPHLEQTCIQAMRDALACEQDFVLLRGKMVVEAKTAGIGKANAIAAFMRETPFAGKRPVFVGDDLTDEDGFTWVQSQAGYGIKVGAGPSQAHGRIASAAAVRNMLAYALEQER